MKTRSVLFIMICMAVINANAQTFMSKDDRDVSFQSQSQDYFNSSQTMRPVSNYEGTIYTPFGANAPSDYSDVNPNNNNAGGGPGSIRKGFITGPDTPPAEQFPVGEPWILLAFASLFAALIAWRKKNRILEIYKPNNHDESKNTKDMNNFFKNQMNYDGRTTVERRSNNGQSQGHYTLGLTKLIFTITLLLTLGVGQMWAAKGFFTDGQWNVKYYDGSGSDKWIGEGRDGSTKDLGIKTTLYLKGSWVKTWSDGGWTQSSVVWNYGLSSSYGNTKTATKSSVQGNQTWDFSVDYNVIANAPNNPGQNTIYMYWRLDDYVSSTASYINFTIPGFKKTSVSQDFGNVTVSSTKDLTISFTQHYGTALTTSNCALSGTNSSEFEVRSISETGVTVRFKPSSNGSKSATLTITDAHSKTCTITLSGKTQRAVTYKKGDNGTGSDITDYKVYNTNLTLRSSGFTRTGYNLTAWNTSSNGTSGTSYALGATYSSNNALTLYPTWTAKTTTITLNNAGATTAGTTEVTATYDATIPTITIPTKTGYTFGGYWGAPSGTGPKYINADGTGNGTWQNEESTYTLYAAWAENKSTVTLVASPSGKGTFQIGGETVTSTTAGVATTREVTAVPIAGYSFDGWSISGGASISSTTDNPTTITGGGAGVAATLTATFVEDLTYYTLKFNTRSGETSNGSVTAKDDSDNPLTSGSKYLSGTIVTVTATPEDDYKFDSWYHGWSTGSSFSTVNPLTFTLMEATNVYAHFVQKTTSITLNKNGGSGGTAGPVTATHGSTTLSTNPLVCPAKSGYTFTGYWTESSGGTKVIDTDGTLVASVSGYTKSGNKKWDYDDATLTLYAQWTENMTTVTINVSPAGTGTLTVGGAAFTPGNTTTAGKTTSRTVVATAANDYTFGSWSVTDNATGTNSTNTYTLKGNGSGGTGTLTANFTLVDCKLKKLSAAKNGTETDKGSMSYDATEHAYYKEITTDASPYYFRFTHNGSTKYCTDWKDKYEGGYTSGKEISANGSKIDCDQSVGGWTDKPAMYYNGESGTTIKIWFDYQNKKVWITADKDKEYVLRGANADDPSLAHGMPGWSATTSYFDGLASGNTGTITCTLNAGEWYHLKVYDMYNKTWYGTSTSGAKELIDGTLATMGSYDDFYFGATIDGDYTFTLDKSSGTKIKVDYPVSYQVQLEVGTVKGNKQTPGIYLDSYTPANKIESGSFVPAGSHVIFVVASSLENAAKTGYTWCGFFDNAAGSTPTQYTNNEVTTYHINPIAADAHVYACFYENDYTVTVNAGTGGKVNSLSSTTVTGHVATLANLPTATADPGYYFVNWTTTAGTLTNSTSATTGKINGLTSTATVTANFAPIWTIAGLGGDWDVNKLPLTNTYVDATVNYAYLDIDTLRPNTTYQFKAIQRSQGSPVWWRAENASDKEIKYTNSNTRLNMVNTTGDNFTMKTAGAGRYTFDVNLDNSKHPIKVHYPTSYTVTFGSAHGTVTATVEDATTITTGQYAAEGKDITFTQTPATGYEFKGWYDAESGGSAISCMSSDNVYDDIAANITVYAQYDPKEYTVTLTNSGTGYGSGGQANLTATYDAPFPPATMPTAAQGYGFMGYWSAANGEGTQFTDAEGHLLANIEDYSDESGNWKYDGTKTLYAYYKRAEITGITFSPAAAEPGDEVTATAAISPTPSGTTTVCWEVRYASNDIPLSPQPTLTPASGASVTFTAPPAAVYKFIATLKTGNECSGGTVLDTENANLTVAGSHPVTIRYKHGDVVIKEETIQNIHATVATEISAPNIIGYSFSSWTLGDGITLVTGTLSSSTIGVTAIYDGTITANYTPKRMIYFHNTLGWSGVNVYFYKNDSYWNASNGTGSSHTDTYTSTPFSESKYGAMTRIEGTNIWYFDAEDAGVNASYDDVVFTEYLQYDYHFFSYKSGTTTPNKVTRRGDYKSSMPMFVPIEQDGVSMNGGQAIYYNEGYWMNYPENTGYKVMIYNAWNDDKASPARSYYFPYSEDKKMPLKLDVEFNTADAKWFMIYRNDGTYMGVNAVMTQASHTNYRIKSSNDKIKIQPSATGIYTYTLTFYDDGEKDGGGRAYGNMYHISVDYPVSVGDYRILYKDNATWSQGTAHTASWNHPSDAINKISGEATEAKKDTVSLFVSYGASATAKFQYVTAINPTTGAVTWADVDGGTISLSSITKSGTYNFIVTQPVGGASVSVEKIEAYTGNYYIRTDCAGNTKWDNYRAADHQMTYSEFSCSEANSFGEKFSHYFAHWCPAGMNVKFVIANDYSSCISDTLIQDVGNPYANINEDGFLNSDGNPEETENRFSANIRFMYNEATNKISRAYVASSTNKARWFLVLRSNTEILDDGGDAMEEIGEDIPSVILDDKQNWIYEQTLQILPGSKFKLFACYAEVTPSQSGAQYFRGYWASDDWSNAANTIELVGGSPASGRQLVRVLYDFKTNRLVCAWLPSGEISDEIDINADVMIIREHQEDAQMITFANANAKLTDVKTVYGTMKFNRWTLNNKSSAAGHAVLDPSDQKSIYERALYFISFPFDVNLGEVFGFGTYGVHWIIENYDGENRAKNGYWIDSEPNWKYVMSPKGYTLEANKGYILALDLDQMRDDNEDFWSHDIETVELFFPSAVTQSTIEQNNVTIPAPDPSIYQCTINRPGPDGDRRIKDSYWRCLGVPSFANYTTTLSDGSAVISWQTADNTLPYLYYWNMEENTLVPQSTSTWTFKTMHAYLTQCSTQIIWTAASKPTLSSIVARRAEDEQISNIEFRLELAENEVKADQAYVRFSTREDVTSGFEFGNDLSKEMNVNKSNIYTLIGSERAAANSLPLSTEQTTIVPVGVVANAAGEYTFSIPEGTDGVGVTFIDNETGIHTQLGALDYTVTLDKGTYESRFYLEISPIHSTPTDVGEVRGERLEVRGVRKVIIDQNMYIIRDGKMYNVQGARCN